MICQTQRDPWCNSLDYSFDSSKAGLSVYPATHPANGNSTRLLMVVCYCLGIWNNLSYLWVGISRKKKLSDWLLFLVRKRGKKS